MAPSFANLVAILALCVAIAAIPVRAARAEQEVDGTNSKLKASNESTISDKQVGEQNELADKVASQSNYSTQDKQFTNAMSSLLGQPQQSTLSTYLNQLPYVTQAVNAYRLVSILAQMGMPLVTPSGVSLLSCPQPGPLSQMLGIKLRGTKLPTNLGAQGDSTKAANYLDEILKESNVQK